MEIEMILPKGWPTGEEMLKSDEASWPVQWLRRLAWHPHQSPQPIGKLFFYPNGSPPQPSPPIRTCATGCSCYHPSHLSTFRMKSRLCSIELSRCMQKSTSWSSATALANLASGSISSRYTRTKCSSARMPDSRHKPLSSELMGSGLDPDFQRERESLTTETRRHGECPLPYM